MELEDKKANEPGKGDRVGELTSIVAISYKWNKKGLKKYFNSSNDYVAGIATGAYAMITGDTNPLRAVKYGGLGATLWLHDEEFNERNDMINIGSNQLRYAKLGRLPKDCDIEGRDYAC